MMKQNHGKLKDLNNIPKPILLVSILLGAIEVDSHATRMVFNLQVSRNDPNTVSILLMFCSSAK